MDIPNCVMALYTVLLVCLLATAITNAQGGDESIDAYLNGLQLSNPSEIDDYANTAYYPDAEEAYGGSVLSDLLKRSRYTSTYQRLPRIKQQRIIPFYSYGNDYNPRYRSQTQYGSRHGTPYYYTPWNADTYRPSRYLNKQIYAGYRRK